MVKRGRPVTHHDKRHQQMRETQHRHYRPTPKKYNEWGQLSDEEIRRRLHAADKRLEKVK